MRNNMMTKLLTAALALTLSVSLFGCTKGEIPQAEKALTGESKTVAAGTILLSVNPEIEVEYDSNGVVLEIEGVNDDGKSVANGYTGYEGRDCAEVVGALVQKIYEGGYFENAFAGHAKNIIVKLEDGSQYPNDDFLETIADSVRKTIAACGANNAAVTVDRDDLDEQGRIGMEKARELVLTQLGLTEATFSDAEYELDDGVYEMEFTANGVEYEYEVDAVTGKVLEADYENNDDWDDDDDDLDDNDGDDDDDLDD